jgi:uncharacterized repeat protein (TIGR01451 family)
VEAVFDAPLKHAKGSQKIQLDLGTLNPQEDRALPLLTLTPTEVGRFSTTVNVKADGGLADSAQQTIIIQAAAKPQLAVKLIAAPRKYYVGWDAKWEIVVTNESDVALKGVQVKNLLPPELIAQNWTEGGKAGAGEVNWDIGDLNPREQRTLTVNTRCDKLAKGAANQVVATAAEGITARDQVSVDIFGMSGLLFEVYDKEDPVQVGKTVQYYLAVTNTGSAAAAKIDLRAILPKELQLIENGATGPTAANVQGQVITFATIDSLAPQQKVEFQIEARALQAGDIRFHAEMRSPALSSGQPVIEEEATRIIEPLPDGK